MKLLACALAALLSAPLQSQSAAPPSLRGTVTDSATGLALAGATVEVPGTRFIARSGDDGRWTIGRVPAGTSTLRIARLGYAPRRIDVRLSDGATVVDVALAPAAVPLAAVVVSPGFYGMLATGVTPSHALTRQQIESAPQLGEDIFRSIARLPGVSTNDMSARFTVRAAGIDQLYSTLDGLELDEPFHLKDLDGALSILDVSSISGLDMSTGGFTSEFGNRLGGVLNLHSVAPRTDRVRHALSLSILNARYTAQGALTDRGGWYVSARRGYIDIALKLIQEDDSLSPRYHDLFAKTFYEFRNGSRIGLHALSAGDRLIYSDNNDQLRSRYRTNYLWATFAGDRDARVRHTTVLSTGRLSWLRDGDIFEGLGPRTMLLREDRSYDVSVLRSDWQLDLGQRSLLKAGVELKQGRTDYDYFNWIARDAVQGGVLVRSFDTTQAMASPSGNLAGAYLSSRFTLARWLIGEMGVRADRASWAGDVEVSPRVNLVLKPAAATTLRASVGRYTQPQQLHELHAADGVTTFGPVEISIHRGLGIEQRVTPALVARVELYDRALTRVRPRFVNQAGGIKTFPEVEDDRLRLDPVDGRSRGVELLLQHDAVSRVAWSASYSLASATERIGARDVPRPTDQRHAVSADWAFRPRSNRWLFSAAGHVHSGWPATPRGFTVVPYTTSTGQTAHLLQTTMGEYATERLPAYKRVDVRFTRYWDTRGGRVALYADVFNLLGATNPRGYNYAIFSTNPLNVRRNFDEALPRLPSLGVSWEF